MSDSPFIFPDVADDLEVFTESNNAFVKALGSSVESLDLLNDVIDIPESVDGKARIINSKPEPYTIEYGETDRFFIKVDGESSPQSNYIVDGSNMSASYLVDSINDYSVGINASVVVYQGLNYILLETKSSGPDSSIEFPTEATAAEPLGFSLGFYGSEQYYYTRKKAAIIIALREAAVDLRDIARYLKTSNPFYYQEFNAKSNFKLDYV